MRVKHYISVLLVGSVLGALAFAAFVGLSLRAQREALRVSGQASADYRNVEALASASSELLAVFDILTTEQSGVVLIAQRSLARCRAILTRLGASEYFANDRILGDVIGAFELMATEGELASIRDDADPAKDRQLGRFDEVSLEYLAALDALETRAGTLATRQVRAIAEQAEWDKVLMTVCGFVFLAGVLALRYWITTRLVVPLNALSLAADKSMGKGEAFDLEETGPQEIRELTRLVKTFVGSLERQIERRTRDLENTNLELEGQKEEAVAINGELRNLNATLESARADATLATKAKTEFLANMSHEIRTPMTAILGYSETLRDGDLTKSEERDAIETIHKNGGYLLGIINDILDMSKIEAGKMTMEHIPCSVFDVVNDVMTLMKVRTDAKGLVLSSEFIGTMPETIRSDPTRLKQILINVIGNAVKFTEKGGIRLLVRFCPEEVVPQIQFDVIDSGIGMSNQQARNLFQAFSQADSTTTRKFGGTGLGLTISKRFAEMLGGDLAIVDTKAGLGTRVRATIATGPMKNVRIIEDFLVAATVEPAKPVKPVQTVKPLNCRILLAEDGPDNQRLISFVLKKAGAEVTIAENGQIAVDEAMAGLSRGQPFDVILMDMQMPVLDGYEATITLRQEKYEGPIIALTAHAMDSDRQKCLEAGCDDFATKPIDRAKLIALVRQHLKPAKTASPTSA